MRPVFGPRNSLDLSVPGSVCVLFGDETSIGLAAALRQADPSAEQRYIFEANDASEARLVLDRVGIGGASVIGRQPDGAHRPTLRETILATPVEHATYLLTGNASSIQYVSQALKQEGVPTSRIRAKAYWAAGKVGLD